jgi:hypothetical protein
MTISQRGAGRRLAAFVVGVLALFINIAAGTVAAQQRHEAADPLVQLTADLAILCASDGTAVVDTHHRGDGGAAFPHCQSCLPFFASALAPRELALGAIAYAEAAAEVLTYLAPAPARPRPASIGARGPPLA